LVVNKIKIKMSVNKLPILPHDYMCRSPIYNDTRWETRPQFNRQGNAGDNDWLEHPLQPPYFATDTPLMSYDLTMWKDFKGNFKPEVAPDPCDPYALKYCSFGKKTYVYDHDYPSLTLPPSPCSYMAKTLVPDVACLDQQDLMGKDRLDIVNTSFFK
jgi:hypothetical protein